MSFRECIEDAVAGQRVSRGKADKGLAAYDEAYEAAIAEGLGEGIAAQRASAAAMEQVTTLNAAKRWSKLNEMQRVHEIWQRIKTSDNPARELEELMGSAEDAYETVRSIAMANLDRLLMKYKPRAFRRARTDGQDDIARAHFGEGGDAEAKEIAEALFETMETLRKWANDYGAAIPESKSRYMFQTHDAVRVGSVTRDVWVNDHLREGVLDWEVMKFEGKDIPPARRREVLERTYDGIVSDGKLRERYLQEGGAGNVASRLARDRFLHYAGAEAWLEMQGKYGAGNLFEQTIGMIDAMAKDISLLRVFGPNADSIKEWTKRVANQRGAEIAKAKGGDVQKAVKKLERASRLFDDMYDIHSRRVTSADGNAAVQFISGLRTVAVGSKLGGVLIPSFFGDLANARLARQLNGMPLTGVYRNYFKEVAAGNVGTKDAIRLGVIFENGIGLAHARMRYFGALDGPAIARAFSDQVYRIGLAAAHTQIARNAEGKQFLGFLADTANRKFDDHPMASAMLEAGITEADWNIMRAFPKTKVSGAEFLVPLDMFKTGDAAQRRVAEKFSDLMQIYVRLAVPDTTLRSRRAMGEAIDPNSFLGQMVRTTTSLMAFPVSLFFNQLTRIAHAPRIRDKLVLGGAYFVNMTLAGAAITQAKALANGQQLHDMTLFTEDDELNLDFWGRAVVNGGSMGILGDLIFNNINVSNSSYRPGNPTEEYLKAIHKMTIDNVIDAAKGDDLEVGADVLNFIDETTPDFWYMKLLMERSIMDKAQEMSDPAGYRATRRYEREHAEGMWWGQGQEAEAINPATTVGDY